MPITDPDGNTLTTGFTVYPDARDETVYIAYSQSGYDNTPPEEILRLHPDQAVRLARELAEVAASACGIPDKRLTFLRRQLDQLEGLAAGKTIAEIAEQERLDA
jgi:hypothetical protein